MRAARRSWRANRSRLTSFSNSRPQVSGRHRTKKRRMNYTVAVDDDERGYRIDVVALM